MEIHKNENNSESQQHLEENKEKFSEACKVVLDLLRQGVRLTVKNSISEYNISSLPRRIKDLRDINHVEGIKDRWVMVNGKASHKEWYMDKTNPTIVKKKLEKPTEEKTIALTLF